MNIPESMKEELNAWNGGSGIDLESWVGCEGNFKLAIGYLSVFWTEFVEFENYILRKGFSEEALRGFEESCANDKKRIESVMNHLHIFDIQHYGCEDISKDKIIVLGNGLKEIYQAKLHWQFPNKPCNVSFYQPEDENDLEAYEITFWQIANEK